MHSIFASYFTSLCIFRTAVGFAPIVRTAQTNLLSRVRQTNPMLNNRSSTSQKPYPQYAKLGLNKDIETVWHRPSGEVKGIFFFAHGCNHQATDLFSDNGKDGWAFNECTASNFKRCLGLPEEMLLREQMRKRGYLVAGVSGGSGKQSCWNMDADAPRAKLALDHIRKTESLQKTPLILMGGSSGGHFMGELVLQDLEPVSCIVPMISGIRVSDKYPTHIPAMFIHMERDKGTSSGVLNNMNQLKSMGVKRVEDIVVKPQPLTKDFLHHGGHGLTEASADRVLSTLRKENFIDELGYLNADPRRSAWRSTLSHLEKELGGTAPDTSTLSELMNIAYAMHECVGYGDRVADFCEA